MQFNAPLNLRPTFWDSPEVLAGVAKHGPLFLVFYTKIYFSLWANNRCTLPHDLDLLLPVLKPLGVSESDLEPMLSHCLKYKLLEVFEDGLESLLYSSELIVSRISTLSRLKNLRNNKALHPPESLARFVSNSTSNSNSKSNLDLDKIYNSDLEVKDLSKKTTRPAALTPEQRAKLISEKLDNCESLLDYYLERISDYCEETGRTYKNLYRTVSTWQARDVAAGKYANLLRFHQSRNTGALQDGRHYTLEEMKEIDRKYQEKIGGSNGQR